MNGSIFFASFGETKALMSKSRTSPAMRVAKLDASKPVTGPMPERPWVMDSQAAATVLPTGETMPRPVTTTRRWVMGLSSIGLGCRLSGAATAGTGPVQAAPDWLAGSGLDVGRHVVDRLLHAGDLLRFLIRNLALELFFQRHHEFDRVEGIRAQVVDERGVGGDVFLLHAQLVHDDLLDTLFDAAHWF